MLRIYPLSQRKSLSPICAYWSFATWYTKRNVPFSVVMNEYRKRADMEEYPYTFIALQGDLPVGMVSVKESELARREELSPWLSALYVAPEYREQRIGEKLIRTVIDDCRRNKMKRIFLFLDSRNLSRLERYYTKRGWIYYDDETDSDGNRTKIFFYEL
ncbi:MAG TPA: GNAT family N-acetyltransferase [Spirochaetota bacterium]|nr:GNAT family N-acetyltransferase [Spirochaetota bacterium]HRX46389.1 GNAT family N-acetyltransferase [Spirochaetota bacterium]